MRNHAHVWGQVVSAPVGQGCRSAIPRLAVCPADHRHQHADRPDNLPPCSTTARISFASFPKPAEVLKVFIMRPANVAAPAFSPVPAPTFTWAAIRFVVSLGALIGISLLLASF